jgi:hypothetical protein
MRNELQVRHLVPCALLGCHRERVFEEIGFVRELLAISMMIVHTKRCHRTALGLFRATLRD